MSNENIRTDLPVQDPEETLKKLEKALGPDTAEILRRNSDPTKNRFSKKKRVVVTPLMRAEAKGFDRQIPEKDR